MDVVSRAEREFASRKQDQIARVIARRECFFDQYQTCHNLGKLCPIDWNSLAREVDVLADYSSELGKVRLRVHVNEERTVLTRQVLYKSL